MSPVGRFVHEFALAPTPHQARLLGIRLDLGRQMSNAMLAFTENPLSTARFSRQGRADAGRD